MVMVTYDFGVILMAATGVHNGNNVQSNKVVTSRIAGAISATNM